MNPTLRDVATPAPCNPAKFAAWERKLVQSAQWSELIANAKLPLAWELALLSLREAYVQVPAHVSVHEVPAPKETAPFAAAISGETTLHVAAGIPAVGRLVLLFGSQEQSGQGGQFRVVALVASETKLNLGEDPLAGEVAWSQLHDALAGREAYYSHLVGTATATANRSFSDDSLCGTSANPEIRALWTPTSCDLPTHFLVWVDALLRSADFSLGENVAGLRSL